MFDKLIILTVTAYLFSLMNRTDLGQVLLPFICALSAKCLYNKLKKEVKRYGDFTERN